MNVFIITEGNAQTGYGHLTRCLSIYQGFEEHDITPTLVANCDENGKKVLGNISLQSFDWIENQDKLVGLISGADIAIIDSYLAPLHTYEKIYRVVKKAVYFDDTLRLDYPPGTIINGAVNAEFLPYTLDDHHSYFLGLDYTPLRKAFWDIPERIPKEKTEDILITMGGVDLTGTTFQVLETLIKAYPHLNYHVVNGHSIFEERLQTYRELENVKFYYSLDANEMRDLMLECELAISGAGQTVYELERCGVKCILIKMADNQVNNIEGMINIGFIKDYLNQNEDDFSRKLVVQVNNIMHMQPIAQSIGNGAQNIVKMVIRSTMSLRQVKPSDIDLLLGWANDLDMRRNSFSTQLIDYNTHKVWFENKIKSADSLLFIASVGGRAVGQIRFDRDKSSAFIDYFIDSKFRGLGLGSSIIGLGIKMLLKEWQNTCKIKAIVKNSNIASQKALIKNTFKSTKSGESILFEYIVLENSTSAL